MDVLRDSFEVRCNIGLVGRLDVERICLAGERRAAAFTMHHPTGGDIAQSFGMMAKGD